MRFFFLPETVENEHGAVAIIVGLCLVMLIGFAGLSIDIGNLLVARNELQNAADAGALAGARYLYNEDGTSVNVAANQIAYDAATDNNSQKINVDVNWQDGNTGDIQRGHYYFSTNTFEPNPSLNPPNLEQSETALENDFNFINAVQVVTRRETPPITSFFASVLGFDSFEASAKAVAYIGFAGSLRIEDIDLPIAICSRAIIDEYDNYNCSVGRMINSGGNLSTSNTGGWTSFVQPCAPNSTSTPNMRPLTCNKDNPVPPGNSEPIKMGEGVSTDGGMVDNLYGDMYDCWWENSDGGTQPWEVTLLVIECDKQNVDQCSIVEGAVTVTIIWMTYKEGIEEAPLQMGDSWPTTEHFAEVGVESWEDWAQDDMGQARWDSFANHFNLQNLSDDTDTGFDLATHETRSIYFLPDCEAHDPRGGTGGQNFGILARIPVLVKTPEP